MARITVEDCLSVVENRFELVLMASKRARQLATGVEPTLDNSEHQDKPTVMALREIAARKIDQSLIEAAKDRFRPILMTSFAFILGVVPMVIASGAGDQSRHSLGTGVFAGMLIATAIGVLFIPLFFYLIAGAGEKKSAAEGEG